MVFFLVVKAIHIIAMVAWFAGLFYLPRLYVYHVKTIDSISIDRFQQMEGRLYYYIMWPAALITTISGVWLLSFNFGYYLKAGWLHAKLFFVLLVWVFHLACGHFLKDFRFDKQKFGSMFFRFFNELPTLLLMVIVFLVILKPF